MQGSLAQDVILKVQDSSLPNLLCLLPAVLHFIGLAWIEYRPTAHSSCQGHHYVLSMVCRLRYFHLASRESHRFRGDWHHSEGRCGERAHRHPSQWPGPEREGRQGYQGAGPGGQRVDGWPEVEGTHGRG